jgi:uncharacterized cupin superfamily protein
MDEAIAEMISIPPRRMTRTTSSKSSKPRTSLSAEGFSEPFSIDDVPWQKIGASTKFKRLGRFGYGSHVGVGIDVLKPGQHSNRFHYHLREEEHIYIIKGSATLILGDTRYTMKERNYCCFPAGQRAGHHLFNHTKEDCLFMTSERIEPMKSSASQKPGGRQIERPARKFR